MMSKPGSYRQTNMVKEDHHHSIYCITFNFISAEHTDIFASAGGNRASVYKLKGEGPLDLLQAYVDEQAEEEFFVCKWSINETSGAPLLLVAGKHGVVRVLDTHRQELVWTLQGHGDAINDIAVQPNRPSLILTASRDHSLRLWNLQSRTCVLVMTGDGGHRNEVLSIDFHPTDSDRFISCGMDNTVKIWSLKSKRKTIERSFQYNPDTEVIAFQTGHLGCPIFSTHKVHWNYVDCVRWLGDLVLSKSVDNRIIMWKLDDANPEAMANGHVHFVQELVLEEADVWFIRFSLDFHCNTLACGTRGGRVYVFDPYTLTTRARARMKRLPGPKMTVRQTAVSYDGAVILCCCDDATIWRFDISTSLATPAMSVGSVAMSLTASSDEERGMED